MPRVTIPFKVEVLEVPPVEGTFLPTIEPKSQSVPAGTDAACTVTFETVDGFNGMIHLAVLNLPEGASAEFRPNPAAVTDAVTLVLKMTSAPGIYDLELEADSTPPPLRKRP